MLSSTLNQHIKKERGEKKLRETLGTNLSSELFPKVEIALAYNNWEKRKIIEDPKGEIDK